MRRIITIFTTVVILISSNSSIRANESVELLKVYHSVYDGVHSYSFSYRNNPDAQILHTNYNYADNSTIDFNGYELNPNNKQFNFWFVQPGIMTITVSNGSFSFVVSYNLVEVSNIYAPMVRNAS